VICDSRQHRSLDNINIVFDTISDRSRAPSNELNANLTKCCRSRLSRNRHISQEQILHAIYHKLSSLSIHQHSEKVARPPHPVLDVRSECAAVTIAEWDAIEGGTGHFQSVQSEYSTTSRYSRSQERVKRTIRGKRLVMEYFLGTIRAESHTVLQTSRETDSLTPCYEQNQYEHTTSYTIYPATWLIRLGFHCGLRLGFLSSSTQGWKNTIMTFCPVPDDALIFEFSKEGNLSAVRKLLSGGHASVRDTDSLGYTPLHVSCSREIKAAQYPNISNTSEELTLASSLLPRIITRNSAIFSRVREQTQVHSRTAQGE